MQSRELILVERPAGVVSARNFRVETRPVRALREGEALVRARYLAIEPLLRGRLMEGASYAASVALGECMVGRALCEVLASTVSALTPGSLVEYWHGWRDIGIGRVADMRPVIVGDWPEAAALGVFGASGVSAYLALTQVGRVKAGDTVVISAAAGAVGGTAVQLALSMEAVVIAVAGGPTKCAYAREELGAHHVLDYKNEPDLAAALRDVAPSGVDVFLDSVGGNLHDAVMANLARHARIIVFGTMDFYANPNRVDYGHRWLREILVKRASVSGFLLQDHLTQSDVARTYLEQLWRDGALNIKQEIRDGLATAPEALADVIAGAAMGKVLVRP